MAGFAIGFYKCFAQRNCNRLKPLLEKQSVVSRHVRSNHMFKHLALTNKHGTYYLYEVSKDPKEWEFVEKLMPFETVPLPEEKPKYPSGWRPQKDAALKHPYYIERTKNHMLPVYLNNFDRGQLKVTTLKKIHGDIWKLHNELKDYVEEQVKKKVSSYVREGNCSINFKGDYVYYAEQWLLSKGF